MSFILGSRCVHTGERIEEKPANEKERSVSEWMGVWGEVALLRMQSNPNHVSMNFDPFGSEAIPFACFCSFIFKLDTVTVGFFNPISGGGAHGSLLRNFQ